MYAYDAGFMELTIAESVAPRAVPPIPAKDAYPSRFSSPNPYVLYGDFEPFCAHEPMDRTSASNKIVYLRFDIIFKYFIQTTQGEVLPVFN